jgi:RsbT co-antagonist protein rsbRD N-terminal domain
VAGRDDLVGEGELRRHSAEFLAALAPALRSGDSQSRSAAWAPVRELLATLSRSRTLQGFTPTEIATFVFSFKRPLFARLRRELAGRPRRWSMSCGWPRRCSTVSGSTRRRSTSGAAKRSSAGSSRRCSSSRPRS